MSDPLFPYAAACAGTYEGFPAQIEDVEKDIHVYLSEIDGALVFAFEGTSDFDEWIKDFEAIEVPVTNDRVIGPIHAGLLSGVLAIFDKLKARVPIGTPWEVTGHSKGAGEALIFAALMLGSYPPRKVRAFEPPRVGGPKLAAALAKLDVITTATENRWGRDLVTLVPWNTWALQQWSDPVYPRILTVPDNYDVARKHKIPAVLEALANNPNGGAGVAS